MRTWIVKQLFQVFSSLCSKEKRDRDRNVVLVQSLKDQQNQHNILERKAELAARREKMAQQSLCEATADVEV